MHPHLGPRRRSWCPAPPTRARSRSSTSSEIGWPAGHNRVLAWPAGGLSLPSCWSPAPRPRRCARFSSRALAPPCRRGCNRSDRGAQRRRWGHLRAAVPRRPDLPPAPRYRRRSPAWNARPGRTTGWLRRRIRGSPGTRRARCSGTPAHLCPVRRSTTERGHRAARRPLPPSRSVAAGHRSAAATRHCPSRPGAVRADVPLPSTRPASSDRSPYRRCESTPHKKPWACDRCPSPGTRRILELASGFPQIRKIVGRRSRGATGSRRNRDRVRDRARVVLDRVIVPAIHRTQYRSPPAGALAGAE